MNQKEIALRLIEAINRGSGEEIYRLLTRQTTFYSIDEDRKMDDKAFFDCLKRIPLPLEVGKILESKEAIKCVCVSEEKTVDIYLEVRQRRIVRAEINFR